MNILIVSDAFPPSCTSGAIQIRDLVNEFVLQGHMVCVIVAAPHLVGLSSNLEIIDGHHVLRIKTLETKNVNRAKRFAAEFLMPFMIIYQLRRYDFIRKGWDGIVWYSPSIFLGLVVGFLRKTNLCSTYLIIRDIFPEWALDVGLLRKRFLYHLLRFVANYQYSIANTIGVQSAGNLHYFSKWRGFGYKTRQIEVLENWLSNSAVMPCSIDISKTRLRGKKILVYAGNMGDAQDMLILLKLAESMKYRLDIGFIFVGKGSEINNMKLFLAEKCLDNVLIYGEIEPHEIPGLYMQCHIGMFSLNLSHKSHNIPGKFISYMQSGLPVLASINPGNDLVDLIEKEAVGIALTSGSVAELAKFCEKLIDMISYDKWIQSRCRSLFQRRYSTKIAAHQITSAFSNSLR